MLSGISLLQTPVVAYNTGHAVGHVEDVLLDPFSKRLTAFVTNQQRPGEMVVVPWTGIKTVYPDQVVVWAPSMLVRAKELFEIQHLLRQGTLKPGTQFQTSDGRLLGTMADFYFDERSGAVIGYHVTAGETSERYFVPASEVIALSKAKGIAHTRFRSTARTGDYEACLTRLQQARQRLDDQAEQLTDPTALARQLLPQLVGCPAQLTLTTPDGYLVVLEGQVITNSVIYYAQQKQSETALLSAVRSDLNTWLDQLLTD